MRVAVVGAGVSGLVAAFELARCGCRVDLLEASDRIGGQVRSFAANGVSLELGARQLHRFGVLAGLGSQKAFLSRRLRKAGARFRDDDDLEYYLWDGDFREDETISGDPRMMELVRLRNTLSRQQGPGPAFGGLSEQARGILASLLAAEYGADLEALDAASLAEVEAWREGAEPIETAEPLAGVLSGVFLIPSVELRLRSTVNRIRGGVAVDIEVEGGGTEVFDGAVVAVSPAVIAAGRPAVDDRLAEICAGFRYGAFFRVIHRLDDGAVPEGAGLLVGQGRPATVVVLRGEGVTFLESTFGGEAARSLGALGPEAAEAAAEDLRRVAPGLRLETVDSAYWAEASTLPVAACMQAREAFRRRVDAGGEQPDSPLSGLVFCGEALHPSGGQASVAGAAETGLSAARSLLARLRSRRRR